MNALPSGRDRSLAAARALPRRYLEHTTCVRVRFHEVDSLRIVWHGHYVAYFEEARRAFGRQFGLDYPVFLEHGIAAPIVQLRVDYLAPARASDLLEVTARLFRSESAKLEFEFEIRRQGEDRLLAVGSSLQVFTRPDGELLLQWPPLMQERYRQWESLWKHASPNPP
jgi:acyl-CoA thioester hydrolase